MAGTTGWWKDAAAMTALVLVACAVSIQFGERIGVNAGQGWDGMAYTLWSRDFPRHVITEGLTRYHAQRVLPSLVVHDGLQLLGIKTTIPHIITAFSILNTLVLAASATIWAHLGHALKLARPVLWVGFVALFVSHANLKHALYYPTLTDPTAFFLGMLLVWSYVTDKPVVLWLVSVAGVLTWPALPPLGLALLVLPRPAAISETETETDRWPRVRIAGSALVALALAVTFAIIAVHYLHHPVRGVGDEKFAAWVLRGWLPVTLALLVGVLAAGWYVLVSDRRLWRVDRYLRDLRVRRTVVALVGAAALFGIRAWWLAKVGRRGEGPTGAQFMCEHTLAAIRGPLWGPVHHVVFFGPIILVAALAWRRLARVVNAWGPAAVLALAMALAFAAGSNSRQWSHLVPFVVVATVVATADLWTRGRVIAFAVLALAWSKVWLTLGYNKQIHWHQFPNQRYFMHHGPYASDTMYLVHLGAAVVTLGVLAWLFRGTSTRACTTPRGDTSRDSSG